MKSLTKIVMMGIFLIAPLNTHKSISKTNLNINSNKYNLEKIISKTKPLEIFGENQKSLGINFFDFYRLIYSDKNDTSNPNGGTIQKKTEEELYRGKILRDSIENIYEEYIVEAKESICIDGNWSKIIDGKFTIPKKTYKEYIHEALDVFTKEGTPVLAPFSGLVVASGDNWDGKFEKGKIIYWNNKGLTPRAGNALIIYEPLEQGYLLISHMQEGLLVKAGEIICRGQTLGYVGNSGNASIKGHGEHIHTSYKIEKENNELHRINFSERIRK